MAKKPPKPPPDEIERRREAGEGWRVERRRFRHGVLEIVRRETTARLDTPEGLGLYLDHKSGLGPLDGIEAELQALLAEHGMPAYEPDWWDLEAEPDFDDHPGFQRFENEAHPVRRALEALGMLARARRFELLATMAPAEERAGLIQEALNETVAAGYLAGELFTSLRLERRALAGEGTSKGGRTSAERLRLWRETPSTEERITAWREEWARDGGPKYGRRKRIACELAKRFGTTESSEAQFFVRNRRKIVQEQN